MSHKTRVNRHITVDLIAAVAAGSLVAAITLKSAVAVLLCVAAGAALILLERNNIQEEDELDTPFQETVTVAPPQLSEENLEILRLKATHPEAGHIPVEAIAYYVAGLEDGAAEMAKWVLGMVEGAE